MDDKKKAEWIAEQYLKEQLKPSGLAGNWSWRLKKEREYKALLESHTLK